MRWKGGRRPPLTNRRAPPRITNQGYLLPLATLRRGATETPDPRNESPRSDRAELGGGLTVEPDAWYLWTRPGVGDAEKETAYVETERDENPGTAGPWRLLPLF